METFLKVVLNENFLFTKAGHRATSREVLQCYEQEHTDFEQPQPELCRAFLVVMDYDPQSLCITGQPDLELSVQSGWLILPMHYTNNNSNFN